MRIKSRCVGNWAEGLVAGLEGPRGRKNEVLCEWEDVRGRVDNILWSFSTQTKDATVKKCI